MKMEKIISTLNIDQKEVFNEMNRVNKLQICLPTGVGKGYLMGVDLKNRLINGEKLIAISSHRLILNNQHMGDILLRLSDMISDVRFIFVGSSRYNQDKLYKIVPLKELYKKGLDPDEIILHSLSKRNLKNKVNRELNNGNKVVIISTYHSLDKLKGLEIDTLYCDEAHTLASKDNSTKFETNFKSLTFKNSYFFTATPKDLTDSDDEGFLMNNEAIFGERVGMSMNEAITRGYITRPIIHMAIPKDYKNEDMDNLTNKVKFITDTFKCHTEYVKESSSFPDKIEPKMLIKCESVNIMWGIYSKLLKSNLTDVKLYAGASRKGVGSSSYEQDGIKLDKEKHLESLKMLKDTEKAIVLHVDTLSEGVNVKGFTGVMFLTDKTPTVIKLLQNIGRATRVIDTDRNNLSKGLITTSDYKGWVKPNTFVILPVYSPESDSSQSILSNTVKRIRDKSEIAIYKVSIGNDNGKGKNDSPDPLSDNENTDPRKKLVNVIDHNIEQMYIDEKETKENIRLNSMDILDIFDEIENMENKLDK